MVDPREIAKKVEGGQKPGGKANSSLSRTWCPKPQSKNWKGQPQKTIPDQAGAWVRKSTQVVRAKKTTPETRCSFGKIQTKKEC